MAASCSHAASQAPRRAGFRNDALLARLWICFALLVSFAARAQETGSIAGRVVNNWDASPLPGVVVSVRGTTLAALTDSAGNFYLKNVPPGDHALRLSKSGFASAVVTEVRVLPGQTTTMNGNLRPEFYRMEEYEVTAAEFTEQTEQIILTKQKASTLVDAIGSDFMSKVGVGDAAEALGKVSGASVADGKYAVVRGLADRYTTTTLNGTELPSADPDRKAAQLDLLPAQVIGRLDVSKTFTPDMAGGFAGGSLNIVTKSFPEDFLFSFSYGMSYNTQASLNDSFLTSDQGGRDQWAMDDGTRALPAIVKTLNPAGTSTPLDPAIETAFRSSQFSPIARESPMNSSMAIAVGDSHTFKSGLRLGYFASMNYKNEYKFYDNGRVRKYDQGGTVVVRDKLDARGVAEYNWAGSTSVTLGLGEHHEIKFNWLYVQAAEDEARRLQGQDDVVGTTPGETLPGPVYLDQSILHWTERNLNYLQLAGHHELPDFKNAKLDWAWAKATATQAEPDYRIFQFVADPANSDYIIASATPPNFPTRYWRDLEETSSNLRGDLTIELPSYNAGDNFFKIGGAKLDTSRDYFQRGFEIRSTGGHPFHTSGDPQSYLDPTNSAHIRYFNFPANVTYKGEQTIDAFYFMGDWALLDWIRIIGGARLERTELTFGGVNQTLNNRPLEPGYIKRDDWLPSLSGVISLRSNLQLRAAWSRTVVRPAYREIAPVVIYDIGQSRTYGGNPNLQFAESSNYDLRLEWFPRPGEVASISLFRKYIDSPIEQSTADRSGDVVTYVNYDYAKVEGVEAELRTRLDRLWEPLGDFTLGFNGALIKSEVPLTQVQIDNRGPVLGYGDTATKRPLFDQPEYVLNADLTWDYERTGTAITLSGGIVGRRLIVVGLAQPDEYEEPAPQLDVFLTQKIGKHWKLKLSAKNLLDPAYSVTQDWPATGSTTVRSYTRGMTFGFSLGCEF